MNEIEQFELITDSIKETVEHIFFFNQDLKRLLKEYNENEYDYKKHTKLIKHDLPSTIKACILNNLSDDDFLDTITKDTELMFEVLPYLTDGKLTTLLTSVIESVTIPLLLRQNTFLTDSRISKLKDINPIFIVSNRVNPYDISSVNSVKNIKINNIDILKSYLSNKMFSALTNILCIK